MAYPDQSNMVMFGTDTNYMLTAKQLVTQCSNIWKMGLLSWVEIDEAQHTCYTEGEP